MSLAQAKCHKKSECVGGAIEVVTRGRADLKEAKIRLVTVLVPA